MAILILETIREELPQTRFPLSNDPMILGRGHPPLFLRAHAVSRVHARIVCRENQFFIEDLNSRHGTWVNGLRISSETELKNQDRIRLSNYVLRFENPTARQNPGHPALVALLQAYYQEGDEVVRCAIIDWLEDHGDRRADLIRDGYRDDGFASEELGPFPQTDRAHRDWMHWMFPELEWPPQESVITD